MQVRTICVAGFGHTHSAWLHIRDGHVCGCRLDTPEGSEEIAITDWFKRNFLSFKVAVRDGQARVEELPLLAYAAGIRAVSAIRDFNTYELAIAMTANYSWQLVNGAKPLPDFGELAKFYAGTVAVYIYATTADRDLGAHKVAEKWIA